MAVIEFVRVVVVGSKLEVARGVPWRKGNCSRIRLSTTSKPARSPGPAVCP
jgi:hypothetical protein